MIEQEVPYEEDAVQEEAPEEAEILVPPEPPVLKRSSKEKLQDRVECPDCKRQVSRHTLLHTHRCPAKKKAAEAAAPVAEPPAPVTEPVPAPVAAEPVAKAPKARAKRAAKAVKPALPEAEVQKPLKQRAVINRAEKAREYTSAYATNEQPQDLWSQLMMQRQMQSRMRAEAVASPYAQMFAAQRSRVM
jgi:hypothetical protein